MRQNEATKTDINVNIKHNATRNIDLSIVKDISGKIYEQISTIEKNSESGYYIVTFKSDSCTLQHSNKIVKFVIKAGEVVYDAVYLNPLYNFKKLYTTHEN